MSEPSGADSRRGPSGSLGVRRRRPTTPEPGPDHLVRSERWNGLRPGDAVRVAGTAMRGDRWEFRVHVHNRRTDDEWVEVVGGRSGDRALRSFSPERIYPAPARSGARRGGKPGVTPSLADAPQLPLE
ncbi:MAG: hypothetical protein JO368_07615 [Acidimicrobiales bacterium]|nr:hypothetical protein [Acidimicrobiales bacterium]